MEGQKLSLYIFECVMSLLYLAVAIMMLFTSFFNESLSDKIRLPLGIVLGVYGLFRIYRVVKKLLVKKNEE